MAARADANVVASGPSEEAKKLHTDLVAEIHKREVSSSENFDKSVLTLSSAGLALSIGFLKDFVPIGVALAPWTLYLSWALFTLATCSTMVSFLVSSRALADQKVRAFAYYMQDDEEAFHRPNRWNTITTCLNYTTGASFLVAMILSVAFISINLEKGSAMQQLTSQHPMEILKKGLTVPTMQQVQRPTQPQSPAGSAPSVPAQAPSTTPAK